MSQDTPILNSVWEKIKIAGYAKRVDGEISHQDKIELHNMRDQLLNNRINEIKKSIKAMDGFLENGKKNSAKV